MAKHDPFKKYAAQQKADDLAGLVPEDLGPEVEYPGTQQEAAAGSAGSITESELRQLAEDHLCPNCADRAVAEEERLRIYAEMDNFKKRLQREQAEQMRYASEKVLADILPALDNMDLALQYGGNEACKPILMGVEMTRKTLLDALQRHGLEPVGETGQEFDPLFHEAVGQEEVSGMEPGLISNLLQRGYKLGDRLLRPARVMVSR